MKIKYLKPIVDRPEDYEDIEAEIEKVFVREIYGPLIAELQNSDSIQNSFDGFLRAIQSGRISFYKGKFTGKFSSSISKELKRLGAKFDKKTSSFVIPKEKLPNEVLHAVSLSASNFQRVVSNIDRKISSIIPEEVAKKVKLSDLFEKILRKTDSEVRKNIAITPHFTEEQKNRISSEYTKNTQLYIQDWVSKEIVELRQNVQKRALEGIRYESLAEEIHKSYGVSLSKAKFLARQETSLIMTKFAQTRYQDAGVEEYMWQCVKGSQNHPVRPFHKKNDGKIYRWDNPPTVNDKGDRKNPGQDYNCRCKARPVVRF